MIDEAQIASGKLQTEEEARLEKVIQRVEEMFVRIEAMEKWTTDSSRRIIVDPGHHYRAPICGCRYGECVKKPCPHRSPSHMEGK